MAIAMLAFAGALVPAVWSIAAGDGVLGRPSHPVGATTWAVLTIVALLVRAQPFSRPTRRVFLIDIVWVSLAYVFNTWSMVLWPPLRDSAPAGAPNIVSSAPTVLVLTAFVTCSLSMVIDLSPRMVCSSVVAGLAALGVVVAVASDHGGLSVPLVGSNAWTVGWAVLGLAALRLPDRVTPGVVRTTLSRQLFVFIPVGIALLVATVQDVIGSRPPYAVPTVVGLLVSGVFVLREIVGWAHTADLLDERQRVADQMRWSATHDELTGLLNRSSLSAALDSANGPEASAVLFIDLDHFKVINDSLGHVVGDSVLCTTAQRLTEVTRPEDVLARFGGDEFVVVLTGTLDKTEPVAVAERLRKAIAQPIEADAASIVVTASIGVTRVNGMGDSIELLRDADTAMYRAKALGRDRVDSMLPEDHRASVRRLEITSDLRRALAADEFVAFFQPIVDLRSRGIIGFEALARWVHPTKGILTPNRFLDVAEETGLIGALGDAVLRHALARLARWQAERPDLDLVVSVNASVRQLVSEVYPREVAQAIRDTGADPDRLWLEITETGLMTDTAVAAANVQEIHDLGVHFAVDDFGTGYGSLTYLRRFPVEVVKVDRSFVSGIGARPEDEAIAAAVIGLGHALDMRIVAEGIEHQHQADRLRSLGCDLGQGYLFGRPIDAAAADVLLARTSEP